MIELKVSEDLKKEALIHSAKRMEFEYDRFDLSNQKRESMILIGTIGQLVFKEYLESQKVKFHFEYQSGKYDLMDFKLGGEIVEIKTSGYEETFKNLNLLYSIDQFNSD